MAMFLNLIGRPSDDMAPSQSTSTLKKELIKIFLLELALPQIQFVLLVFAREIFLGEAADNCYLPICAIYWVIVLAMMVVPIITVAWSNLINGHDDDVSSARLIAITIPILFLMDWRLTSVLHLSKQERALSEDDKIKLRRWKILVRWFGHLLLVLLAVAGSFTKLKVPGGDRFDRVWIWYVFLITGMLAKLVVDAVIEGLTRKFELKNVSIDDWIPMKWIVMVVFAYLPSVIYVVLDFTLYHVIYEDFNFVLPLVEGVILTMYIPDYEEMRLERRAKNVVFGAGKLTIMGILFYYCLYGRDMIKIGVGASQAITMWSAHFVVSKLYV